MVAIKLTSEFVEWLSELPTSDQENCDRVIEMLSEAGVKLPFPYSSQIDGPLRELRVKSKGKQIRIFYQFDSERNAWLLIGGVKGGANDKRFYKKHIEMCKKLLKEYSL